MEAAIALVLLAATSPRVDVERTTPPVRVEAVKPAEIPEDPTSFTTVLELEEYEGEQKRVEDLLEEVPGVDVRRFGGPGELAEVSIRGSSPSQVVVLLDGVRLNSAQTGSVDLATIPSSLIDRIEVSRGGGSVQTGSDAIGGVINIVSKRPGAKPETTVSGAGGSFGTWQAAGSQTGRIGPAEVALGYDFFRTDGDFEFQPPSRSFSGIVLDCLVDRVERVNNEVENHTGFVRIGADLGERARVTLSDQLFYGSAGRPGLALCDNTELQRQRLDAHLRRTRNVASVRLEGAELGPTELDADLLVFHRYERNRFVDDGPPVAGITPVVSDNRNQAVGGRLSFGQDVPIPISDDRASLGAELREDWHEDETGFDTRRRVVGVFGQYEVAFLDRRVRIVPGFRIDVTEGFGLEPIPRLGIILEPFPWLRLKGNVERSYRVPTFDELYLDETSLRGNPALRPEEALNADVGLEIGFDRILVVDEVRLEVAAFRNEFDRVILFQTISPSVVGATNIGRSRAEGLEITGGFGFLDWVRVSANLTLQRTEIEATGSPIPGRPDLEYGARVVVGPPSRILKLVGEARHTSSIPLDAGGVGRVSARTTFDASLALDLGPLPFWPERVRPRRLALVVTGTNLTDQSVFDARGFPQPGRFLLFGAEGAW